MSLVTRCPQCATTFRVSKKQLSARGGRVRCGQCSAVFDGVSHLVTDAAAAVITDESVRREANALTRPTEAPEPFQPLEPTTATDDASSTPVPDAERKPAFIEPHLEETLGPLASAPAAPQQPALEKAPDLAPPQKITVPAFLAREHPQRALTLVWAVLASFALTAFALQGALHFRTEIAVLLPATRPFLEGACEVLGCSVRLPRRADLMSIESSDLQADSQRPGVIVLNALLRNRAPFAQEYPDLELTLTDQGDQPVIRRVLGPVDYLQEKRAALGAGLAGGAEETVRIHLDTSGVAATGYQLFLFYSCPPPASSAFWQLSYPSRCQDSRNTQ